MEMEPWLQTLLTILGTILASSGFWAYIQERSKRKAAENKHNNLETHMLNMEAVLTDAAGKELARLTKVFSADGKDITSTVVYGK